jgi:hypothetical protein
VVQPVFVFLYVSPTNNYNQFANFHETYHWSLAKLCILHFHTINNSSMTVLQTSEVEVTLVPYYVRKSMQLLFIYLFICRL